MTSPPTKKELEGIEKMTSRSARFSALRSVRDVPLGMLLHDQPEREAIWQLILADAPKTEAGGSLKPTDTVVQMYRSVRFWRHVRFLGTYKGFVKGKLDLTGRHPERWNEFILQFAEYMKQFEDLVPTLKATHSTHKFEDYEFTDTSYEIQDPERYSQWIDRWELDGSRSKSIITATFTSRELYEQKLPPKLQQLQFLELPQELLEQIFDHCEKQDMVSLAKTCRSLKHSGYAHLLQTSSAMRPAGGRSDSVQTSWGGDLCLPTPGNAFMHTYFPPWYAPRTVSAYPIPTTTPVPQLASTASRSLSLSSTTPSQVRIICSLADAFVL
ncbi:hypothetical protein BKA70DRAFT_1574404 [Coprinopsis sp. MPI-PUGE-AT-0042]|nr:hypothetical protein BKA70DRAFT_1574404 [Coprinopsis sp. MPI-PUGE-AT-0042]